MSTTLRSLVVKVGADLSAMKKGFSDGTKMAGDFGKGIGKIGRGVADFGIKAAKVTAGVATAFAGMSVAVGKKSLEAFAAFEGGMNEVFTLLPGISGEAMDKMEGQLKDFSKEFGVITDEAIPALYQALSAGVPQDNVFDFLETAQKAARGGVTGLETAVDGISSVINAYGTDILGAGEASDLMFTAVRLGKCVTGDTRVLLSDGRYKRIDELQDGGEIVSFDGRAFIPMTAAWVDQGVKPTVTLKTRLGREISTTWNHPYLTQDGWKKVIDLKKGDRIAVPTALPFFGDKEVQEHEAAFLGLWLAEGSCNNGGSPRVTTTKYGTELTDWAERFGCTCTNIEKREGFAPQYQITARSRGGKNTPSPVQIFLRDLGAAALSSDSKRIPEKAFAWSRKSTSIMLRWLFNGDGWLSDMRPGGRSGFQVGFVSKSKQLVYDVSHLLLRFGIVGTIRNRGNCFVWEANRYAEVERFVRFIGIDRPAAEKVLTHSPDKQRAMWGMVEYDPIVSIEPGKENHVYDLCVPDLHNFVANDIIAHNTTFDEMSKSLFNVVPTASSLGVGFDEVTAAIATMTAQGVPTTVATTQMRQAMVELSKDGSKTAKLFKDLTGKSFNDFVKGGGKVTDAFEILEDHAEDSNTTISSLFGSVEAGNAALALTGRNTDTYRRNLAEMERSAGATDAAFEQMDQGITASMNRMKSAIEVAWIEVGDAIAPAAEKAVTGLTEIITGVEGGAERFAEGANELVGSFIAGLTDALPDIIDAGLSILNGVVEGLTENKEEINKAIVKLIKGISDAIQENLVPMTDAGVALAFELINAVLDEGPALIDVGLKAVDKIIEGITDNIDEVANKGVEVVEHFVSAIAEQDTLMKLIDAAFDIVEALALAITRPDVLESILTSAVDVVVGLIDGMTGSDANSEYERFGSALSANIEAAIDSIDWAALGGKVLKSMVDAIFTQPWEKMLEEKAKPKSEQKPRYAEPLPVNPWTPKKLIDDVTKSIPINVWTPQKAIDQVKGWFSGREYATGTDYVPRTGPAILHEGEAVIPKSQNRGGSYNLTVNGASSPEQVAGIVVQRLRMAGAI